MDKFELLGKEVTDMCKANNIEFKWTYDDITCTYILKFKQSGKKLNLMINEKDLYIKPFALVKAEVEHYILSIIKKAS